MGTFTRDATSSATGAGHANSVHMVGSCLSRLLRRIRVSAVSEVGVVQRKLLATACAARQFSFKMIAAVWRSGSQQSRDALLTLLLYYYVWCDLNRTPIVIAKHGGSCVHFSGISTCGRTSPETVSHPQRHPLPTAYKISLPVYVIVTNKRLQLLATTLYNSLVLSFSLLKI